METVRIIKMIDRYIADEALAGLSAPPRTRNCYRELRTRGIGEPRAVDWDREERQGRGLDLWGGFLRFETSSGT